MNCHGYNSLLFNTSEVILLTVLKKRSPSFTVLLKLSFTLVDIQLAIRQVFSREFPIDEENHLHSCKFQGKFFVLTSITARIPGHGNGAYYKYPPGQAYFKNGQIQDSIDCYRSCLAMLGAHQPVTTVGAHFRLSMFVLK